MTATCRQRPVAPRWGLALGLLALVGCEQLMSQTMNVCVSAYNQRERAIHGFWLDDENNAGCWGNVSGREPGRVYAGGGGFVCGCTVTPGETVTLDWEYGLYGDEFDAGVESEKHSAQVIIPEPQSPSSRNLRLYFLKNGETMIDFVDGSGEPILMPPDHGEITDEQPQR